MKNLYNKLLLYFIAVSSHRLPLTWELALERTLNRQVPKTKKQMKCFKCCLITGQWGSFFTTSQLRQEKKSFLSKKGEKSFHGCPGLNPCFLLLRHRLCFEEAKKNLWYALLFDQTSPDVPSYVSLAYTWLTFPWLWQTWRHCVFLLLKKSLWYFLCQHHFCNLNAFPCVQQPYGCF